MSRRDPPSPPSRNRLSIHELRKYRRIFHHLFASISVTLGVVEERSELETLEELGILGDTQRVPGGLLNQTRQPAHAFFDLCRGDGAEWQPHEALAVGGRALIGVGEERLAGRQDEAYVFRALH